MNLSQLAVGSAGIVTSIGGEGALRQHILDMGVIPGQKIEVVKLAPLGDPMELEIRGYSLTMRLADAENIEIEPLPDAASTAGKHPGHRQLTPEEALSKEEAVLEKWEVDDYFDT